MTTASVAGELLQLVTEHLRRRCSELAAGAQSQAQGVIRAAHRGARARLHENIQILRHERKRALALADAELQTAQRQHQQRSDQALLATAWPALRVALTARWRDRVARRRWVERVASSALQRLPPTDWRIDHPPDWPAEESQALAARIGAALGFAPVLRADPAMDAGLRVRAGTALLDASAEGLLADGAAVEALLLAEIGGLA